MPKDEEDDVSAERMRVQSQESKDTDLLRTTDLTKVCQQFRYYFQALFLVFIDQNMCLLMSVSQFSCAWEKKKKYNWTPDYSTGILSTSLYMILNNSRNNNGFNVPLLSNSLYLTGNQFGNILLFNSISMK